MSEWITNTSTEGVCPKHLDGKTITVEYSTGGGYTSEANLWEESWNTNNKGDRYITRYKMFAGDSPHDLVVLPADQVQVGGEHYKSLSVQPWDAEQSWLTPEQFQGFLLGSAISYLARFNASGEGKGGKRDVEKARHYLDKLLEVM